MVKLYILLSDTAADKTSDNSGATVSKNMWWLLDKNLSFSKNKPKRPIKIDYPALSAALYVSRYVLSCTVLSVRQVERAKCLEI